MKCAICDGEMGKEMGISPDDPEICDGCDWNMCFEPHIIKRIIVQLRADNSDMKERLEKIYQEWKAKHVWPL